MSKRIPGKRRSRPSTKRAAPADLKTKTWTPRIDRTGEQRSELRPVELSLLGLAGTIERFTREARDLAQSADATPEITTRKGIVLRRLSRMILASLGLRERTGAPYRDARMMLSLSVIIVATQLRRLGKSEARVLALSAVGVAWVLMEFYPALAKTFGSDRFERIRKAIEATARRRKGVPWSLIARIWTGIEKGEQDSEVWRQEFRDFQRRVLGLEKSATVPPIRWDSVVPDFPLGALLDVERRFLASGQAPADVQNRKQRANGPRGTTS